MFKSKKKKPIQFEGMQAERYKQIKNKWIRLMLVGTLLPLLMGIAISSYSDTFKFIDTISSGEIILSLFSLTIPMLLDLFEIDYKKDDRISWTFLICVVSVCLQVLLYCLTRLDESANKEIRSIIASVLMLIASTISCASANSYIFKQTLINEKSKQSTLNKEGVNNNV